MIFDALYDGTFNLKVTIKIISGDKHNIHFVIDFRTYSQENIPFNIKELQKVKNMY